MNLVVRRSFCMLVLILALGSNSHATPQIGDTLVIGKKRKTVQSFGLLPVDVRLKVLKLNDGFNTANLKGFTAEMTLKNRRLEITKILVGQGASAKDIPLKELFDKDGPIRATWFNGVLIEYFGKPVGFLGAKEKVRLFRFEKGVLVETKETDHADTKTLKEFLEKSTSK